MCPFGGVAHANIMPTAGEHGAVLTPCSISSITNECAPMEWRPVPERQNQSSGDDETRCREEHSMATPVAHGCSKQSQYSTSPEPLVPPALSQRYSSVYVRFSKSANITGLCNLLYCLYGKIGIFANIIIIIILFKNSREILMTITLF